MKSVAFLQDCMEAMRAMPDNAFDLAVVDPIYGDVTKGGYITGKSAGGVGPHPKHNAEMWDQPKTGKEYFDELFRVSRNQIIWGGNYFVKEIARDSQGWIVWDKCHPEGIKFADAELAWTSFNSRTRIFRFLWNGMCQGTPGNGTKMQGNKALMVAPGYGITHPHMDTDRYVKERWVRWGGYVTHWMPLPERPEGQI